MSYRQTFTVQGSGDFPVDMLRYDHCWPDAPEDSKAIVEPSRHVRQVNLVRDVQSKRDIPTIARWQSFTWSCITGTIETHKR